VTHIPAGQVTSVRQRFASSMGFFWGFHVVKHHENLGFEQ
jgi:hypothetical protein